MLALRKMPDAVPAVSHLRPVDTVVVAAQTADDARGRNARTLDHARGGISEYGTKYLWLDAGQSWPFLRELETITNRALYGWLFVVAACVCWAMIMVATGDPRPVEATVQMERLADKLEHTTSIPPATASAVARILGQRSNDCRHVACRAQLADRNRTVRTRLENLLADKGPSNALDLSTNQKRRAVAAEVGH